MEKKICMKWLRNEQGCPYGDQCIYEHSKRPITCTDWKRNACQFGDRCCYIHDDNVKFGMMKWSTGPYCVPVSLREQIMKIIEPMMHDQDVMETMMERLLKLDTDRIRAMVTNREALLTLMKQIQNSRRACSVTSKPVVAIACETDKTSTPKRSTKAQNDELQVKQLLSQLEQVKSLKSTACKQHQEVVSALKTKTKTTAGYDMEAITSQCIEESAAIDLLQEKLLRLSAEITTISTQLDNKKAKLKGLDDYKKYVKKMQAEAESLVNKKTELETFIEQCDANIDQASNELSNIKDRNQAILGMLSSGDSCTKSQSSENDLCSICLEQPKTCAFVPCGHVCVCNDCSKDLPLTCIICRQESTLIMRCY